MPQTRSLRIAIITQSVLPQVCGIGDHSLQLAEALRAAGHEALVIGRKGEQADRVEIVSSEIGPIWLNSVDGKLKRFRADHVTLQYTPLLFSGGDWRVERRLSECWRKISGDYGNSLIIHETYYRDWRWPPSFVRGMVQKVFLKRLVEAAGRVFTASTPLHREICGWGAADRTMLLPIGSNIPLAETDTAAMRRGLGIGKDEVLLTLFGGGNSLKWNAHLVNDLDAELNRAGIPHCWLLLGSIAPEWFKLHARVLTPGLLEPDNLSAYLQISDIFLLPHVAGVSAKRGTLMAALQHGLPVVGTEGPMTDDLWVDAQGVTVIKAGDVAGLSCAVLGLCRDPDRRRRAGEQNAALFNRWATWPRVVDTFLRSI